MTADVAAQLDAWLARCAEPGRDPLQGMAEAGLLEPAESYLRIARTKALLVERTGLLGVGGVWAGRQMVHRWFLEGFGNAEQQAAWWGRALAVAISEPGVGAHPKQLSTRAEPQADGYSITGEKAWVSNAPSAELFIVLAITAMQGERKRYSAFLVPRESAGLSLDDMPRFHALRPSQHSLLHLRAVHVPRSALLGENDTAYERMALPFRDVEDAVSTYGLLGCFRFLLRTLSGSAVSDEIALTLGGLVALTAIFQDASDALVSALDAGLLKTKSATLVGLRVLAAEMVQRLAVYTQQSGRRNQPEIEEALRDIDAALSIARGPRQARQIRLAAQADPATDWSGTA